MKPVLDIGFKRPDNFHLSSFVIFLPPYKEAHEDYHVVELATMKENQGASVNT